MYMLVVVLLGHIVATALDDFNTEASFDLPYTGLQGNSSTSKSKGILPFRILSQILD